MRSGSQADPILLDLEDDNEVEFIGDEFAFLNLGKLDRPIPWTHIVLILDRRRNRTFAGRGNYD